MRTLTPTQQRIIAATGRCFARHGVRATSAEEIACEAGVARKTIYRVIGDRAALIDAIIYQRCIDAMEALQDELQRYSGFVEAVVEGIVFSIHEHLSDAVFRELVASEATHGVAPILIVHRDIRALHDRVWMPIYTRARAEGVLLSPLSDQRLIDGHRAMAAMLLLRTDLDEAGRRAFLMDFFVPTLVGIAFETGKETVTHADAERRVPVRQPTL